MYKVYEVDENQKIIRYVCSIKSDNQILDAVITAYSGGNYDYSDLIDNKEIVCCYRNGGKRFDLMHEEI